jgi:hypothetical protein
MEQLEIGGDDGQVRRCLRPWVPTASVRERRESGAMYASPPKRYPKPMKRPPNLEAVYLEGSSGPRSGCPADDRPGSFGRELAVSPKSS